MLVKIAAMDFLVLNSMKMGSESCQEYAISVENPLR